MRFLLVELEGKDEKGNVFDSTKGEIAKEVYGREGPLLIVLGKTALLPGIAEQLEKMKEGEEVEIILPPKKAFGHRDEKKLVVYPISAFPSPPKQGEVLMDKEGRVLGTIKSVSSGRVLVDFNHPLAGRTVYYKVKVVKELKDGREKAYHLLSNYGFEVESQEGEEPLIVRVNKEDKKNMEMLVDALLKEYGLSVKVELKEK